MENILDLKDRKILYELDVNARAPYSAIAKKAGLGKQSVALRVRRMQEAGIINKFVTVVNPEAFGYSVYKVYLKLQDVDMEGEKKILEALAAHSNVGWLVSCMGKFDVMVAVVVDKPSSFEKVYYGMTRPFSRFIREKTATQSIGTVEYNRKHLLPKAEGARKRTSFYKLAGEARIDGTDGKILSALSQDARAQNIEIMKKAGASGRAVGYRIKQLEKEGVIQGYRCVFDREKLGLQYYKIFLDTSGLEEATKKKLLAFCEFEPSVTSFVSCIGAWDIEIEAEVRSAQEFQKLLMDIRNILSDELRDYDFAMITKELLLNYYPRV